MCNFLSVEVLEGCKELSKDGFLDVKVEGLFLKIVEQRSLLGIFDDQDVLRDG